MEKAHSEQRGAVGLVTEDGGKEMIDAPMLKQVSSGCRLHRTSPMLTPFQAENTIRLAMAAGLDIPKVD